MGKMDNPLAVRTRRPAASPQSLGSAIVAGADTGLLHGFDQQGRPLVSGLPQLPGATVIARTTVQLQRESIGKGVVVVWERNAPRCPIIIGVLQSCAPAQVAAASHSPVPVEQHCHVIAAAREIVLRCGEASITLTRDGKVIIKGSYIVSRSTGYNKIKGAAVDIN